MRVPTTQDALWRDVEKTLAGLPVQLPNVRALYDVIKDTTARDRERAGQLRDLIRRRS